MSEYKGIQGQKVRTYTTDPDNPIVGQVWYNATTQTIKLEGVTTSGSWATGGTLNTGRNSSAGAGIQTAGMIAGGKEPPVGNTELYNGTAWTETTDMNSVRRIHAAAGADNTAALYFGGYDDPVQILGLTESWNGSAWTEVNDLNTSRYALAGAGIQTAALALGGNTGPAYLSETESWNGTSWTEVNDLTTARAAFAAAGTQTSALVFGGQFALAITESWNGTSWTEVNDLNTARAIAGGAGSGNDSALGFGGYTTGSVAITESWNGTSWTEVNDLNTARGNLGGTGTQTSALAFGGYNVALSPAYPTDTEVWNGTSWTEDTDLSTARSAPGAGGTSAAALATGGSDPGTGAGLSTVEEWTKPDFTVKTITSS